MTTKPVTDATPLQSLAAYLRREAGDVFEGHPSHATLRQWAEEVEAAQSRSVEAVGAVPVATVLRGGLERIGKATAFLRWEEGANMLPDGEHLLYTAPPSTAPKAQDDLFALTKATCEKHHIRFVNRSYGQCSTDTVSLDTFVDVVTAVIASQPKAHAPVLVVQGEAECENCNQLVRALREATEAPTFMGEPALPPKGIHQHWHHKSNPFDMYTVLALGKLQTAVPVGDACDVVVYQGPSGVWVRPKEEFLDGRFHEAPTPLPGGAGGDVGAPHDWEAAAVKLCTDWDIDREIVESIFEEMLPHWTRDPNQTHIWLSIGQLTRRDDYGVDGSDFYSCRLCDAESGAGVLNKGIPHTPGCPLHDDNYGKLIATPAAEQANPDHLDSGASGGVQS